MENDKNSFINFQNLNNIFKFFFFIHKFCMINHIYFSLFSFKIEFIKSITLLHNDFSILARNISIFNRLLGILNIKKFRQILSTEIRQERRRNLFLFESFYVNISKVGMGKYLKEIIFRTKSVSFIFY